MQEALETHRVLSAAQLCGGAGERIERLFHLGVGERAGPVALIHAELAAPIDCGFGGR